MSITTQFSFKDNGHLKTSSQTLVEIGSSFELQGATIDPPEGDLYARLDHPDKADENGLRKTDNFFDGVDLTALTYSHPNGSTTHCGTGCWLEFRNIVIPKGASLHFWYRFFRFANPQNGHNAIALLLTYPDGNTENAPAEKFLICDNVHLKNKNDAVDSGWQQRSVIINNTEDFQGTIRWVMATGHLVPRNGRPDDRRFALPGSFLLGNIDLL